MLFKFKGFYRQFSYFSLRLLNKKFTSSTTASFPTALTSSPSKNRRGFSIKNAWKKSINSELKSVLQIELRAAYSQLQQKQLENAREKFHYYQNALMKQTQSTETKTLNHLSNNNRHDKFTSENSLLFPLLTYEELKAFDSSVFE